MRTKCFLLPPASGDATYRSHRPVEELAAYVGHFYLGEASGGGSALGGVSVGSGLPDTGDPLDELVVGGAVAQRASQVVAETGEQAGVQLALGRQPRPGAGAAERLGDRGDQTHFTGTVEVAVPRGHLAGVVGVQRLDR